MDICQFCKMYMKPMLNPKEKTAECEFCGEVIAKVKDGKWIKTTTKSPK